MKENLLRLKKDVETMQQAMGLLPAAGREWIHWLKRDRWANLWWCLPGAILIGAAFWPGVSSVRHFGLVPMQWAGLLTAASLWVVATVLTRRAAGKDGRPEALMAETRRRYGLDQQGRRFGWACAASFVAYFAWGFQYHVPGKAFGAGLFLLTGIICLMGALTARAWILLGYAIPFLAYALCCPSIEAYPRVKTVALGLTFVAIALCFSFIQSLEIRQFERANESH